ncbi:sodium-dependent bicarbonate transport family permease [Woodsholea maritima]|uniref:sodium-dependent bicarbonate transport family permease n=1 Tax=Woodsholea maritima TaxID=240237 RepID=UPI00036EE201|nr:sodium-dependent bicarbonate transport family permease [Woodsholea maritima]
MDILSLASSNLLSPPVLFFCLGLFAAFIRSDLTLPEAIAKGLSLYLVMAIGFKGGVEMIHSGLSLSLLFLVAAGIVLSAGLPVLGFGLLKTTTGLNRTDCAAISAHYGSISIVTFIAASDALTGMGQQTGGYMVGIAAAMEAPAILTGLLLAGAQGRKKDAAHAQSHQGHILREVLANGSVVLLIGSFIIGMIVGPEGMAPVKPFFSDIFRGVLCLFLLDMGLLAGRGLLSQFRLLQPSLLAFGIYMALIGAGLGLASAKLLGLNPADGALLMTLCASASYIAVPAALRLALPKAQPALSLTLSLGLTFPFNLILGIPLYVRVADFVL